jgi:uncharacterized membrane protein YtjA (UPF0391 family)
MRWLVDVAGYIATPHDTSDSFRKPFQFGRGAIRLLQYWVGSLREPAGEGVGSFLAVRVRNFSLKAAFFQQQAQAKRRIAMLGWAFTFLIVALIAAVLGFGGIAGVAMEAAKVVFFVAIVLFLISAIFGLVRGRRAAP